jgi:nitrogen fixation protein NifU and related proteins
MQDQLYKDIILEHWKDPQNYGKLKTPGIDVEVFNRYCGDRIRLTIKFSKNKIKEIAFSGEGCAISKASASLFTEEIKGKSITNLKKITEQEVLDLLGINITPSRTKCALLIYNALQKALNRVLSK